MYRLTIVGGPNVGASFALSPGETSIGRQPGNSIVLSSSRISKRHCTVWLDDDGQVEVVDEGSANGTFVNGGLARRRALRVGDRVSVGDFTLELVPARALARASGGDAYGGSDFGGGGFPLALGSRPSSGRSNLIPFPGAVGGSSASAPAPAAAAPAKDLKARLHEIFEHKLMPIFYGFGLKTEWRVVGLLVFGGFLVANLFLSVYPVQDAAKESILRETKRRAVFMARQIAERNAPSLAARAETRTEIGGIEGADGVLVAALVDLDSRVLAPATRYNTYLTVGPEAVLAAKARESFKKGRESGVVMTTDGGVVIAVEPVRVLSAEQGKNVAVAMAVVSLDATLSVPGLGETGVVYSEAMIISALLGLLALAILYRITLKPLEVLAEDLNQALKGELGQVTKEFKFQELQPLLDLVDSAIQRIPKGGGSGGGGGGFGADAVGASDEPVAEAIGGAMRMIAQGSGLAMIIFDRDRKVTYVSPLFEEVSGIRGDAAIGQDVASIARDQGFVAFMGDLFDRALTGSEGVAEDYDFSGIGYRVHFAALGGPSANAPQGWVLAAVKAEG